MSDKEVAESSTKSNVIIISPEEVSKLGLKGRLKSAISAKLKQAKTPKLNINESKSLHNSEDVIGKDNLEEQMKSKVIVEKLPKEHKNGVELININDGNGKTMCNGYNLSKTVSYVPIPLENLANKSNKNLENVQEEDKKLTVSECPSLKSFEELNINRKPSLEIYSSECFNASVANNKLRSIDVSFNENSLTKKTRRRLSKINKDELTNGDKKELVSKLETDNTKSNRRRTHTKVNNDDEEESPRRSLRASIRNKKYDDYESIVLDEVVKTESPKTEVKRKRGRPARILKMESAETDSNPIENIIIAKAGIKEDKLFEGNEIKLEESQPEKRRGRKKKVRAENPGEAIPAENMKRDELQPETRRGRSKQENVEEIIPDENVIKPAELLPVKRRGRKKLVRTENAGETTTAENIIKTDELQPETEGGGLKKVCTENLEETILDETVIQAEELHPKRRGRKKKVRTENVDDDDPESGKRKRDSKDEPDEAERPAKRKFCKTRILLTDPIPENEDPLAKQTRLLIQNYVNDFKQRMESGNYHFVTYADKTDCGRKQKLKKPTTTYVCGICKQTIHSTHWLFHKQRFHNDIAWKEGEKSLDLNDVGLLMKMFNVLYKNKKAFYCDGCGESKKSILGFLTHKMLCLKTSDEINAFNIECSICNEQIMPYALVDHTKKHKEKPSEPEPQIEEIEESRTRRAAQKANILIKNTIRDTNDVKILSISAIAKYYIKSKSPLESIVLHKIKDEIEENNESYCKIQFCEQKFKDLEEMKIHLKECASEQTIYTCKFCCLICKSVYLITTHLKDAHNDELKDTKKKEDTDLDWYGEDVISEDEESDDEYKRKASKTTAMSKFYYLKFLNNQPIVIDGLSSYISKSGAFVRTLFFHQANLKSNLSNYLVNASIPWTPLDKDLVCNYLPKLFQSIPVAIRTTTIISNTKAKSNFESYFLFHSSMSPHGTSTTFCGGPVSAMAWAPTPLDLPTDQVLAVSILPDPDKKYNRTQHYEDCSVIQFWDYGFLDNITRCEYVPKMKICLAHRLGAIWSMEWCPSGCYSADDNRLGVLAVTSTNGYVYGYVVPIKQNEDSKIFENTPVFELCPSQCDLDIASRNSYATSLYWTRESSHKYIAVGYSTGLVALYNLESTSSLLVSIVNNTRRIIPYKSFQAHCNAVTAIALSHVSGGNRYLSTGSLDRTVKFWDLDSNDSVLVSKRGHVKDMVWLLNSIVLTIGQDDHSNQQSTTFSHIREFGKPGNTPIMYANSQINAISVCDWCNVIMHVTTGGELVGSYVKNHYTFHSDIHLKRFLYTYTNLECESDNSENCYNISYAEAINNCKLTFSDFPLDNMRNLLKHSEGLTGIKSVYDSNLNMYPIQSITTAAVNPNKQSFLYTAIGYQAGFVRVFYSKFLTTPSQYYN